MIAKAFEKKYWIAVIAGLLVLSFAQGAFAAKTDSGDGNALTLAPVNPEFINYQLKNKDAKQGSEMLTGYIPDPVDSSYLKGKKIAAKDLKKALKKGMQSAGSVDSATVTTSADTVTYAATYDLRTLGRVSPVKNQGSCGSCWAFASYGSLESEMLPTSLYDLSENNLNNLHGFDPAPCAGGNAQMSTAYATRWGGPVSEAADPYYSATSPTGLPNAVHVQDVLNIPGRTGSLDNDNIKAAIQETGGVYTTIYYTSTSYSSTNKAYYYSGTTGSNHAVTLVGWDDNYDKNKFATPAPGNGAFIVRNSWGTSWGEGGYFYLSYYDTNAGYSLTAFTGEQVTNYNTIYQYDTLGKTSSAGFGSTTASFANIFTAGSTGQLGAVGFYTPQTNTAYTVKVYANPTSGPVTGTLVSQASGTIAVPGFHTVDLATPVSLAQNQKFSVVVTLQTTAYNYPIALEKPIGGYSSAATASAGQSFISKDGVTWTDITSQYANTNVCLKAYAGGAVQPAAPSAAFFATPLNGNSPLTVAFTDQSTGIPTSWAWNFGDGSTSTAQYPTHIYSMPGTYSVTLTVKNAVGSNTVTKTNYITVRVPAPAAAFSANPVSGTSPLAVTFTDQSTNTPTSWAWTFGDGGTSTAQSPSHTYTAAGTYTVTLTATNSGGSGTTTKSNYITVSPPATPIPTPTPTPILLTASFSATPTSGQPALNVAFTDKSTGAPTSWAWDFGDGSTSTLQSPSHSYSNVGTYTVTLTVKNDNGNSKVVKKNYIRVQVPKGKAKASILLS